MKETIEDLGRNSFKIIQPAEGFRLTMDSVLLADFAKVRRGERVVDLCAGCGCVGLLIAARVELCSITAVEKDEQTSLLIDKNARINGISDRMTRVTADIRGCAKRIGYGAFSLAVCNPPYFSGSGSEARHLSDLSLDDVAACCRELLQDRGRACFVFPASGVFELAHALSNQRMTPKRIRMVAHLPGFAPKLALIEAVKNAAAGVIWQKTLYTGDNNDEFCAIYNLPPKS